MRLGQRYEALSPRSGTDRVLLGGSDIVDSISVVEARGSGNNISAAFTVRFSITQFQLRMRVSKQARIEFIARGTFPSIVWVVGYTEYTTCLFFSFFVRAQGDCGTSRFLSQVQILNRAFVQAVMESGSSRSVLRTPAHPHGWMPASASSIGLFHQVNHQRWILQPQRIR